MIKLHEIINFFAASNDFIKTESHKIQVYNIKILKVISPAYLAVLVAYLILSFFTGDVLPQKIITIVLIFWIFILSASIHIYSKHKMLSYKATSIICLIFCITIVLHSGFIGVAVYPDNSVRLFLLALILIGQIFTLSIPCSISLLSSSAFAFLIFAYILKPFNIFFLDVLSVITAYSISIASYFTIMFFKVSEYRFRANFNLLSSIDRMTGVYNLISFEYQCDDYITSLEHDRPYALLLINIDSLKSVNQKYGHSFGDLTIVELSIEIKNYCIMLPNESIVGRIGGDEFIVLVKKVENEECVKKHIDLFLQNLSANVREKIRIDITCSAGAVVGSGNDERYGKLLSNAKKALSEAKLLGKGQSVIYKESKYEGDKIPS